MIYFYMIHRNIIFLYKCRWGDLNPQGFLHTPLKRARIPIPPHRPILFLFNCQNIACLRGGGASLPPLAQVFRLAEFNSPRKTWHLVTFCYSPTESLPHRPVLFLFNCHNIDLLVLALTNLYYHKYFFLQIVF